MAAVWELGGDFENIVRQGMEAALETARAIGKDRAESVEAVFPLITENLAALKKTVHPNRQLGKTPASRKTGSESEQFPFY